MKIEREKEKKRKINQMEFAFDVNYVLPYEVTIFNGDYRILNQGQTARVLYVVFSLFLV